TASPHSFPPRRSSDLLRHRHAALCRDAHYAAGSAADAAQDRLRGEKACSCPSTAKGLHVRRGAIWRPSCFWWPWGPLPPCPWCRSEEHTSELQSRQNL